LAFQKYPEFSWSFSRHKTVMECALKYYLSSYACHNGWLKNSDAITKHIYRLKKLTNIEMLLGESVHKYIDDIGSSKIDTNSIKESVIINHIWSEIEIAIESSFSDYNKWYESPSKFHMLHEVYYENNVPSKKIADLKERLYLLVNNLLENRTFISLIHKKINIQQDSEKFRYMNRNGIKIWLRMDMHYKDPVNLIHNVVDWKTGKSSTHDKNQLALYSHFVSIAYKINDLSKIEIRNEYLLNNESKPYSVEQIDIENMKKLIGQSINHMQSYLEDIEKNIPFNSSCFAQTSNQGICNRCNFKEMCGVNS
jgi:hypothetical protein